MACSGVGTLGSGCWFCSKHLLIQGVRSRLQLSTRTESADILMKRRSFGVCSKMLHIFFKSIVEGAISSALGPLELIVQRKILHEMKKLLDNPEHPLQNRVTLQQSVFSQRLLQICCKADLQEILPAHSNNHL